jgi:hypothetical protein
VRKWYPEVDELAEDEFDTPNPTVEQRRRRLEISKETRKCSLCRPHGGENRGRCPTHGKSKPRYKDKRK